MTTLGTDLVTDEAALWALGPEWRALWRRARGAAFQSPDWLLPWWRQFGTGAPRCATLRDADGKLVAILPLYDLDGVLLPIGAGVTDQSDALLAPEAPHDAATALLRAVLHGAGHCALTELPPPSALLAAAAPPGWVAEDEPASPCPVLTLGPSLEASVPAGRRRKLRMARHRAERAGSWHTALLAPEAGVSVLARLHDASWRARGEPGGILADRRMAPFLSEAVPALAASEAASVHAVQFGNSIAAAALVLHAPGRWLLYLGGFDPERRFESPGSLLIGDIIEKAVAAGVRELDFLRGAEAYKYAWGAQDRWNTTRRLRRF